MPLLLGHVTDRLLHACKPRRVSGAFPAAKRCGSPSPVLRLGRTCRQLRRPLCKANSAALEADSSALLGVRLDGDRLVLEKLGNDSNVDASSSSTGEWERWLKYFDQCDQAAEEQEHLSIQLQDAVRGERYSEAAGTKQKLQQLEAKDAVLGVQKQLEAALKEERYADAAWLRDDGMAGLQGWWVGSGEDDPVGHLLHVQPEYGRWTGRVYRPRDLAETRVRGWNESSSSLLRLERAANTPSRGSAAGGTPVMEVFVRDEGKRLLHQAVSLRPSNQSREADKDTPPGSSTSSSSSSSTVLRDVPPNTPLYPTGRLSSSVVRLSVSVDEDGVASIKALPTQPVRSVFSAWEAAEAEATMAELRGVLAAADDKQDDAAKAVAQPPVQQQQQQGEEAQESAGSHAVTEVEVDSVIQLPAIPEEVIDITAAMTSLDMDDFTPAAGTSNKDDYDSGSISGSSSSIVGSRRGMDRSMQRGVMIDVTAAVMEDSDDDSGSDSEGQFAELSRVPAEVVMLNRDQFVFRVHDDTPSTSGRDSGSGSTSSSRGGSTSRLGWQSPDGTSSGSSKAAAAAAATTPTMDVFAKSGLSAIRKAQGELSFEIEIPVGQLLQQQQQQRTASMAALADILPGDAFDKVAEELAQLQEAKIGRSIPRQQLADAIRELAKKLIAGEQVTNSIRVSDVDSTAAVSAMAATDTEDSKWQASSSGSKNTTSDIRYTRIPTNMPRTDPFNGLYLGAFGTHGPELLRLSRTTWDGEEAVTAVKLTGDLNVPAGALSFRAKVGRKHRLDARDVYPDELGIVARYKGEGRVAQRNFANPRWVEGELLVFAGKGSPLTGGAELGFVWAVPGEKRFLILLNRVDLNEMDKA